MRSYETMIVFHPDCGEAGVKELLEKAKQVIAGQAGEVTQSLDWGTKDLAYRIDKQRRGIFTIIEFKGEGKAVAELERNLRIWDRVLRYITVQVDPNRPPLEPPKPRRAEGGPDYLDEGDDEVLDELADLDAPDLS